MKNLKDVLEKLKVDSIVLDKEFPIDGTLNDMIAFLEGEGFHYIDGEHIKESLNAEKTKCFMLDLKTKSSRSDLTTIWFADTSKEEISKKNPVFNIVYDSRYSVYYINQLGNIIDIVKNDKKKFLQELNKRFMWQ